MGKLLSAADLSAMLQRPIETLRYWRWHGEGPPSFKIGKSVYYDADDVDTWIKAQKAATSAGGGAAA